ncbi:MAG: hypothetical protein IJ747_04565 [Lachnospiraceae bacterium]|nr:hypothetical protein [Lachnospiraceae bacterium]
MRKKGSVILTVLGIVFLIAAIVLGISLCTIHTYVYTSTLGFYASPGYVYAAGPILRLKTDADPQMIQEMGDRRAVELQRAILAVVAVDPAVYRNQYAPLDRQVFPLDGQIYYYRENVFDGFFCLDIATETVRKCQFSEYSKYVHVPDEEKATVNHIGMHSFILGNSILTEGILEHYPTMEAAVKRAGLPLYTSWTYWDNGRIFFVADHMVYEYLPGKDRVRKIARVGQSETVGMVWDAR